MSYHICHRVRAFASCGLPRGPRAPRLAHVLVRLRGDERLVLGHEVPESPHRELQHQRLDAERRAHRGDARRDGFVSFCVSFSERRKPRDEQIEVRPQERSSHGSEGSVRPLGQSHGNGVPHRPRRAERLPRPGRVLGRFADDAARAPRHGERAEFPLRVHGSEREGETTPTRRLRDDITRIVVRRLSYRFPRERRRVAIARERDGERSAGEFGPDLLGAPRVYERARKPRLVRRELGEGRRRALTQPPVAQLRQRAELEQVHRLLRTPQRGETRVR
mmetsp:Transcript_4597/g.18376  ORF Transcript_4597/g.18376 Transcript_4597/m.18376 type:complete len:277 (+) Transcript_4597:59-889(+)